MEVDQTTPTVLPEDDKLKQLYQDYLQKCCEVGQIEYQLDQLESQRKEIEKNLDITQRQRNKAALDHKELQKKALSKLKPAPTPEPFKLELTSH